jgi:hypothetical protein
MFVDLSTLGDVLYDFSPSKGEWGEYNPQPVNQKFISDLMDTLVPYGLFDTVKLATNVIEIEGGGSSECSLHL